MSRLDAVADPELRSLLQRAHEDLRAGRARESVHYSCDAFLRLLSLRPEILQEVTQTLGGVTRSVTLFPQLGRTYADDPSGKPNIEFQRDEFAATEAMMYYEFTLDAVVGHKA